MWYSDFYVLTVTIDRTQAGLLTRATELCDKALHIERTNLGERPYKMAMLYYLQGVIKDEVSEVVISAVMRQ